MATLSVDLIIADQSTQMRAGTRNETIDEYVDLFKSAKPSKWPFDSDLVVFHDGEQYYLSDGWHRYLAAKRANRSSVDCEVLKGTLEDAQDYALGANVAHGLRRTNDDKRKSVENALRMERHAKKSDRAIAELCGVSNRFVGEVRKQVCTVHTSTEPETRTGRDGKEYPAPKPAASRKPEPHAINVLAGDCDEYEDVPDDEPKTAEAIRDKCDRVVPAAFLESAGTRAAINATAFKFNALLREIDDLAGRPGGEFVQAQDLAERLRMVKGDLSQSAYWTHCPRCKGKAGCELCDGVGFMPERHRGYLTAEEKAEVSQ